MGSCALLSIVNVTEHLLFSRDGLSASRPWSFFAIGPLPLLPCAVPFGIADAELHPAMQLLADDDVAQALRYVELCRMACGSGSPQQWRLRLVASMLNLQRSRPEDAWSAVQAGLSWRNRTEKFAVEPNTIEVIQPREWLVMATVALGIGDADAAERYASEAIARVEHDPCCCASDVLCDTRADAMTVFATIRMYQQRYQEAEMLLQLSYDAYVQAGDIEQLAVTLTLLADVELYSGNALAAKYLLCESEDMLRENCDTTRHFRIGRLKQVVEQRLQMWRSFGGSQNVIAAMN